MTDGTAATERHIRSRSRRLAAAVLSVTASALPLQAVEATPLNAANLVRAHGCGAVGALTPLNYSVPLERAAKRYAEGASLQSAAADSNYLAAKIAGLHLSGPSNDAEIEQMLAQRECHTLQDPVMREFGAFRRGREIWMLLAVPSTLPARGDTAAVSSAVLALVNSARGTARRCGAKAFAPAAPLALDASLTAAALQHSRDMAEHDVFDHRGHDGSSPAARVERAGFKDHRIVGENIAAGAVSPSEVVQGWLLSPGHCENIMDGRFTFMGVAFAENLHTRSAVFWTQDFAAR